MNDELLVDCCTSLYGELITVGGNPPTATIIFDNGTSLTCDIDNKKIAKELGCRLYQTVGVEGDAKILYDDNSLQSFRIKSVLPFSEQGNYAEIFAELREIVGDTLNGVTPEQLWDW